MLYLPDSLLFFAVVAVYAPLAPDAGGSGWSLWVAFAVSEAYLLGRIWVRLVFFASEVSLFQSLLAHAGYVAAPLPIWPESPSADALDRP